MSSYKKSRTMSSRSTEEETKLEAKDEDMLVSKKSKKSKKKKKVSSLDEKKEEKTKTDEVMGLDEEEKEVFVSLKVKGGSIIKCPRKALLQSKLIKNMLEADEAVMEDEKEVKKSVTGFTCDATGIIPIPNVSKAIFERVLDYLQHHVDKPAAKMERPLKSSNMKENVADEWDAKFVDFDIKEQSTLFDLILAANYLDIEPLLDLTTAKVACWMKGKKVEELRKLFHVKNDFTPEEEAKIRAENKWAEES